MVDLTGLQHILGFDADDLAANRAGRLSAAQRARYTTSGLEVRRGRRVGGVFVALLFLVIVAGVVAVLVATDSVDPIRDGLADAEPGVLWAVGVAAASVVLLIAILTIGTRAHRRDVAAFESSVAQAGVAIVDGAFRFVRDHRFPQTDWAVLPGREDHVDETFSATLGGVFFHFPYGTPDDETLEPLNVGTYRGYLLAWGRERVLLSAEPLGRAEP
jgi:hypothetical protein